MDRKQKAEYLKTIQSCQKKLSENHHNIKIWEIKAFCHKQLNQHEQYESCIKQMQILFTQEAPKLKERIENLLDQHEFEEALDPLNVLLDIVPDDDLIWTYKSICLHQLKRYEESLEAATLAIQRNEKNGVAWNYHGIAQETLENYENAIYSFDKAILLEPSNERYYHQKGYCYFKLGKYAQAIECFEQALDKNPHFVDAHIDLGVNYIALKHYDKAIETLKKTPDCRAIHQVALAYQGKGELEKAYQCMNEALKLNPIWKVSLFDMVNLLVIMNDDISALEYSGKYIENYPDDAEALLVRGQILARLGRIQEADDCLSMAEALSK